MADDLVPLTGGTYVAQSLTAGAQRSVNLYGERNEKGAPTPFTYYPRPGLRPFAVYPTVPVNYGCRGAYTATNGKLYEVIDDKVYFTNFTGIRTHLSTINPGLGTVFMKDNGHVIVLVDGSPNGYIINLNTDVLTTIHDPAFYGADRVDYLDGYLIFNRPGTTQIYLSPFDWNGSDPFDPLDIADKIGTPDPLVSLVVNAAQLWLIGQNGTEVWYNAGGTDFPLARVPGVLIQHGTVAKYSVCQADVSVFWLERNQQGLGIFLQGTGYDVKRISTHAIEQEWKKYATLIDALAFTYQLNGHTWVHLTFPTADRTWVYDMASDQWHEWTWTDEDGIEHRHRANTVAACYGQVFCGDWATGDLYLMDTGFHLDNDMPIVYRRGFPHMRKNANKIGVDRFVLAMETGQAIGVDANESAQVFLRWSNTQGYTWGDPIAAPMGATGQPETWPTWWQLGTARDFVFEVFWSAPVDTSIQGAYIQFEVTDA